MVRQPTHLRRLRQRASWRWPCGQVAPLGASGDELSPALITRASLAVASPRAIFSFNPPRPVGTCNPYQLLSDVVTDGTFLYYVDNQGSGGRAALWQRDRLANPEDD